MRAFLFGMLVAFCGVGHRHAPAFLPKGEPGPPAWWVADRGADLVWELDADLLPRTRLFARAPVALAPGIGGVWVVEALERDPLGRHQLRLMGPGDGGSPLALPSFLGLATVSSDPVVLTGDGQVLSVRGGGLEVLAQVQGGRWIWGAGSSLWVAGPGGRVVQVAGADGRVLTEHDLNQPLLGLCGAAVGPPWVACGDGYVRRVDLSGKRRISSAFRDPCLSGGWVLDQASSRLQRLGAGQVLELEGGLSGLEAAVEAPDGELLVLEASSLHLLGRTGERRLAQGGFGYAVSAVPASGLGLR